LGSSENKRGNVRINVTMSRFHETIVVAEKQYYIFVSVGVNARVQVCAFASVALLIQQATLRYIVIGGLSGSTILLTLSHKCIIFVKSLLSWNL
jgi:hypothetical protein